MKRITAIYTEARKHISVTIADSALKRSRNLLCVGKCFRRSVYLTVLLLLSIMTASCGKAANNEPDAETIKSYQDIPGVTPEEISAIEALKREKESFLYGHVLETETFRLQDGTYAGFTIKVCELFSDLFAIEFQPAFCGGWELLKYGIDDQTIDFAGSFTPTAERMQAYYMTLPVAERNMKIYTLKGSDEIILESDIDNRKIGFLRGTVTADRIRESYPELTFEVVYADNLPHAAELLQSGGIDVYAGDGTAEPGFEDYDFIRSKDFFQLVHFPVSITTANPEFKPVISVINKYILAGGIDKLYELYSEGQYEYAKHKLFQSFTEEEHAYLNDLAARNAAVSIALENDNYPVSFYNEVEKEFQGIAVDVMAEISGLTEIEFEAATNKDTAWVEIFEKTKAGEISMVSQLLYNETRKDDFIWSAVPYARSYYAIISKADYPDIAIHQVIRSTVGNIKWTGFEDLFHRAFPDHPNIKRYDTYSEGLEALEKGEIDLIMGAEYLLLMQANYREKTGYKVNIRLNAPMESCFGFHKDERILRAIIDKAQAYINTDKIEENWDNRVFDYSQKVSQMRAAYLLAFSGSLLLMLGAMVFLYLKNKKLGRSLMEHTATLTAIFNSLPDLVFSKDINGVYTSCNPSFEKYAGISATELAGKTDKEVFDIRDAEAVESYIEADRRVMRGNRMEAIEETITYPDGTRRIMETIKTPLMQNGKAIGLLGIGRDVTERREAEERHERFINTAQIAFMLTIDAIVVEVNEYGRKHIGIEVGDDIRSFYADPGEREQVIKIATEYGAASNVILKYKMKNGEIHRFLSSSTFVEYGQKRAYFVWAIDIEQDEMLSDQLLATQRSVLTILNTVPLPIGILDAETHTMVYGNDFYMNMMEIDLPEDLDKLKGIDTFAPVQSDGTSAADVYRVFSGSNESIIKEVQLRSAKNKIMDIRMHTSRADYNGRNSVIAIMVNLDKEREYQRMREYLQTVLDLLPVPIRIFDFESRTITYVNKAAAEMFGFLSPDEAIGRDALDFISWDRSGTESFADRYDSFHASLKPVTEEFIGVKADGEPVEVLITACMIDYNGKKSSLGIMQNLTAEKEYQLRLIEAAEREKEANQAKSLFLANMSHEIRTPMNGIIGFSELALDSGVTPEGKDDYLRKIKDSGEVLLQIINDILDVSKIENGNMELENIPFNIHDVFSICQTIITPKANEKGITLYCYAEPSVGKKLLGDHARLRQVLLNLLSNAIKFTNVGMVKLSSSVKSSTDDSVTMYFEVKDSGIGMTQEQIAKVFEPFIQADISTTREYGGTGLGLSIVKNIIELMGGKLELESTPGLGSKFSFELTFKVIDAPVDINNSEVLFDEFQKPVFNGCVLICEDNEINQKVLRDHLTRVGLDTEIAANGQEGVDLVKLRMRNGKRPYDLIFMDIHMPVMDGLEAAIKIYETGNQAPIVALTANVMPADKEIYQAHNMPDYVAKPFTTKELWACLFKYFTPVTMERVDKNKQSAADARRYKRLITDFARDYRSAFKDINDAIEAGDIKLAHRFAHTLKGLAGLMGKVSLQEAARVIEHSLKSGKAEYTEEQMNTLERELNAALDEITPLLDEPKPKALEAKPFDKGKTARLFDILEQLLQSDSVECLELVEELIAVPETDVLIKQMEDYDYELALETLAVVRRTLEV